MFNGTVLTITKNELTKMNKTHLEVANVATLNQWDKTDKDIATPLVAKLTGYLTPVPTVTEFDKSSVGDQIIKVDMALEFPEVKEKDGDEEYISSYHRIVAFQIKSSEKYAHKHMKKYKEGIQYEGVHYPCPGVFWCCDINLTVLKDFAKFVGVVINPQVTDAIKMLGKLKATATKDVSGTWHDYRLLRKVLSPQQWQWMVELKIITLGGGRILYLDE